MDYATEPVTALGRYFMQLRARQTLAWCPGRSVLEIGPGRGVLATEALRLGKDYTALDCDPEVLRNLPMQAKRIFRRVPPIPDNVQYDAIIAEAMLEHLGDYNQVCMFLESARQALVPNGRLILRFPDVQLARWLFWEYTPDHQYVTSLPRVAVILREQGWDIACSGYFVDCFTGWQAWCIDHLMRLLPTYVLHRLTGHAPHETSIWTKLREKFPMTYVVAINATPLPAPRLRKATQPGCERPEYAHAGPVTRL